MSVKFVAGCARFVFMFAVIACMNESRALAQSQSGGGSGLDGGGETETFTQVKRKLPTVAIDVAVQPAPRLSRDVSAEILDRDTESRLAMVVGDNFRFDETPFADVLSQIRNDTNLHIVLDKTASTDLPEDTGIAFEIKGVSIEKGLELLLAKYNCDFIIDHGIIRIISLDVAGDPEFFMLRIYDCSKLIQAVPSLMDRPVPLPSSAAGKVPPETKLVKLVTDTATPGEWALTGSGDGVINQVGNCLIVSQSRRGHRAVQNLISQMESKLIQK